MEKLSIGEGIADSFYREMFTGMVKMISKVYQSSELLTYTLVCISSCAQEKCVAQQMKPAYNVTKTDFGRLLINVL